MAVTLFLVPSLFALAAFLWPSPRTRPWLVPLGGATELCLVMAALNGDAAVSAWDGWLALDKLSRVALPLVCVLFFACSLYVPTYLRLHAERPNRVFCGALLVFLAMMALILLSHNLGLMWVALEATSLAVAPLI